MKYTPALFCLLLLAPLVTLHAEKAKAAAAAKGLPKDSLKPFIEAHCVDCHDAETQKAGLRLDTLAADFRDGNAAATWAQVFDKPVAGEMPPKKRERPPQRDLDATTPFLRTQLHAASLEHQHKNGRDVEKGDRTPGGRAFADIEDYKKILLEDKDQLARNFTQKLMVYATGADIQFADREVVEQIVAKVGAKNYGFRSLIHEVVGSRVFLNK